MPENELERSALRFIACACVLLVIGCGESDPSEVVPDSTDLSESSDVRVDGADDAAEGDDSDDDVSVGDTETEDSVESTDGDAASEDSDDTTELIDVVDSVDAIVPVDTVDTVDASDSVDVSDALEVADTAGDALDADDGTDDTTDAEGGGALNELEQLALDLHNQARLGPLSPPPNPPLLAVTWDDKLAKVAQDHAERCLWRHNDSRTSEYADQGGDGSVGENMAAGYGRREIPLTSFIDGWVDESSDYNYANNSCPSDVMCGHYTQVVWRSTRSVGCGWAQCDRVDGISDPRWVDVWILVCNYGPAGNNGTRPY